MTAFLGRLCDCVETKSLETGFGGMKGQGRARHKNLHSSAGEGREPLTLTLTLTSIALRGRVVSSKP